MNVGPRIALGLQTPASPYAQSMDTINPQQSSIFLRPATPQEISNIIYAMKNSSAGFDNLKPVVIKKVCETLVTPLTHIVNLCFLLGKFLTLCKNSIVTPAHKKGCGKLMSNYRPISVLNAFSKVIEKMMHSRLSEYLDSHNILNQCQFGFRSGYSTELANIEAAQTLINSMNNKNTVVAIFMDLSRAFDTVSYDILFKKMYL